MRPLWLRFLQLTDCENLDGCTRAMFHFLGCQMEETQTIGTATHRQCDKLIPCYVVYDPIHTTDSQTLKGLMSGPLGIDMLGGVTCVGIDPCHQRDAPRRPGICPAMEIPPMDGKDAFAVAFNF